MKLNHNPPININGAVSSSPEINSVVQKRNITGIVLLRLTVFASFIFMVLPASDLIVSGMFYKSAHGFFLSENYYLLVLRDLHRLLPAIIIPVLLLGVVLQTIYRPYWLPAAHKLLYLLSVYAVGTLVVVHGLKYLVGRARPYDILEFGGNLLFSPAWQIARACHSSCSFPSGESATAMALLAIPLITGGRYRIPLTIITAVFAVLVSVNRIMMGAHFLSDVVLSWLFVALVMAWLWPVFQRNAASIDRAVACCGARLRNFR